ncbi:hypothetical protein B0T21DRAFT_411817 [Apiosordaria backusii]|uniref:Uncharacterized protein n=1 Tax=Apiosordaria backusii TaxID=314023 RepID=A0AA40BM10_9PEZI|nr:hypothetical protein B0T21DRAFT_411817 [Apiosordaria backusii]
MSSAKEKPSGIPVASNPATSNPIPRRRSSGGSTNLKRARVKFEDDQKHEAEHSPSTDNKKDDNNSNNNNNTNKNDGNNNHGNVPETSISEQVKKADEPEPEPEPEPTGLPVIEEDNDEPYYVEDDDDQEFYQEETEYDGFQSAQFPFSTPPTSPSSPPGNPPMVTSASLNYDNELSPPLPPYLLFNGTLLLLATLVYALVSSSPAISFLTLLFPGLQLLLAGIVLSLPSQPADSVTPGWKALVQLATVVEWLYFALEVYKDLFGYNLSPGGFLPGGYGPDLGLGDFGPIDLGPLQDPRWPPAARAILARGTRQAGDLLETVDQLVSIAAEAGVIVIWFVVAKAVLKLTKKNVGEEEKNKVD